MRDAVRDKCAELAAELGKPGSGFTAQAPSTAAARRSPSPVNGRRKAFPLRRSEHHVLPPDYLTAEQVRALDRPGTAAAAPVENAAGPLVKEPYWIE